jgi:hypothetical protein
MHEGGAGPVRAARAAARRAGAAQSGHRRTGVHEPGAELRVLAGGAEVGRGGADALDRRLPAHGAARRHDAEPAPEGGEEQALPALVDRAHAQQAVAGVGLLADRHAVVARRRHHHDAGGDRAPDGGVERVALGRADERCLAAEREVDHVGVVGARVVDAAGDVVARAAAVVAERADRHQRRAGRHALDPDPVAGRRADDPCDVGAVAVAVLRGGVAPDNVVALADAPRQVGVVGLHAGVDDRHHRPGSGRDPVRGVGLDQVEVPLSGAPRVGGARGGRQE